MASVDLSDQDDLLEQAIDCLRTLTGCSDAQLTKMIGYSGKNGPRDLERFVAGRSRDMDERRNLFWKKYFKVMRQIQIAGDESDSDEALLIRETKAFTRKLSARVYSKTDWSVGVRDRREARPCPVCFYPARTYDSLMKHVEKRHAPVASTAAPKVDATPAVVPAATVESAPPFSVPSAAFAKVWSLNAEAMRLTFEKEVKSLCNAWRTELVIPIGPDWSLEVTSLPCDGGDQPAFPLHCAVLVDALQHQGAAAIEHLRTFCALPWLGTWVKLSPSNEHRWVQLVPNLSGWVSLSNPEKYADLKFANIESQLCTAVKALHDYGLAHGDLHPRNIMVHPSDGKVQLIDFGAVRPTRIPKAADPTETDPTAAAPTAADPEVKVLKRITRQLAVAQQLHAPVAGVKCPLCSFMPSPYSGAAMTRHIEERHVDTSDPPTLDSINVESPGRLVSTGTVWSLPLTDENTRDMFATFFGTRSNFLPEDFVGRGGSATVYPIARDAYCLRLDRAPTDTSNFPPHAKLLEKREDLSTTVLEHCALPLHGTWATLPSGENVWVELMKLVNGFPLSDLSSILEKEDKKQIHDTDSVKRFLEAIKEKLNRAVQSLHDCGLAHGDLKPQNVMVGAFDGREPLKCQVTLIDFTTLCKHDDNKPLMISPGYYRNVNEAAKHRDEYAMKVMRTQLDTVAAISTLTLAPAPPCFADRLPIVDATLMLMDKSSVCGSSLTFDKTTTTCNGLDLVAQFPPPDPTLQSDDTAADPRDMAVFNDVAAQAGELLRRCEVDEDALLAFHLKYVTSNCTQFKGPSTVTASFASRGATSALPTTGKRVFQDTIRSLVTAVSVAGNVSLSAAAELGEQCVRFFEHVALQRTEVPLQEVIHRLRQLDPVVAEHRVTFDANDADSIRVLTAAQFCKARPVPINTDTATDPLKIVIAYTLPPAELDYDDKDETVWRFGTLEDRDKEGILRVRDVVPRPCDACFTQVEGTTGWKVDNPATVTSFRPLDRIVKAAERNAAEEQETVDFGASNIYTKAKYAQQHVVYNGERDIAHRLAHNTAMRSFTATAISHDVMSDCAMALAGKPHLARVELRIDQATHSSRSTLNALEVAAFCAVATRRCWDAVVQGADNDPSATSADECDKTDALEMLSSKEAEIALSAIHAVVKDKKLAPLLETLSEHHCRQRVFAALRDHKAKQCSTSEDAVKWANDQMSAAVKTAGEAADGLSVPKVTTRPPYWQGGAQALELFLVNTKPFGGSLSVTSDAAKENASWLRNARNKINESAFVIDLLARSFKRGYSTKSLLWPAQIVRAANAALQAFQHFLQAAVHNTPGCDESSEVLIKQIKKESSELNEQINSEPSELIALAEKESSILIELIKSECDLIEQITNESRELIDLFKQRGELSNLITTLSKMRRDLIKAESSELIDLFKRALSERSEVIKATQFDRIAQILVKLRKNIKGSFTISTANTKTLLDLSDAESSSSSESSCSEEWKSILKDLKRLIDSAELQEGAAEECVDLLNKKPDFQKCLKELSFADEAPRNTLTWYLQGIPRYIILRELEKCARIVSLLGDAEPLRVNGNEVPKPGPTFVEVFAGFGRGNGFIWSPDSKTYYLETALHVVKIEAPKKTPTKLHSVVAVRFSGKEGKKKYVPLFLNDDQETALPNVTLPASKDLLRLRLPSKWSDMAPFPTFDGRRWSAIAKACKEREENPDKPKPQYLMVGFAPRCHELWILWSFKPTMAYPPQCTRNTTQTHEGMGASGFSGSAVLEYFSQDSKSQCDVQVPLERWQLTALHKAGVKINEKELPISAPYIFRTDRRIGS